MARHSTRQNKDLRNVSQLLGAQQVGCSICEATTPSYKPWNGSPNENRLDYFLHSLELHLPISRSFQLESNLDRLSSKLERAIQHKVELKVRDREPLSARQGSRRRSGSANP
ncbi:hypothetical protein PSTT_15889 [Puccinia striiformis]|uniref:Uncharacterized protein n=1 Tax=Puccinia striiformis TaxID=27350 RepID=A0A2S4UFI9_9BASI|nr:hypothetical protein PSTT_15889 [Puccinia striiformis]